MKELNPYQIVHEIAQRTMDKEIIARNPLTQQDEQIKTVNKIKEKTNLVKETYEEVMEEIKSEKKENPSSK